jgi:hypothetical protein
MLGSVGSWSSPKILNKSSSYRCFSTIPFIFQAFSWLSSGYLTFLRKLKITNESKPLGSYSEKISYPCGSGSITPFTKKDRQCVIQINEAWVKHNNTHLLYRYRQCCGAGPFLCGSGSATLGTGTGTFLSKADTRFPAFSYRSSKKLTQQMKLSGNILVLECSKSM